MPDIDWSDISGVRFGILTALSKCENHPKCGIAWTLRCDCGNLITRTIKSLRESGPRSSCGCNRMSGLRGEYDTRNVKERIRKDVSGHRFGSLVAIEPVSIGSHGQTLWRCKCDCGNFKNVLIHGLRGSSSCGCVPRKMGRPGLPPREAALNEKWFVYRKSASKRGIQFNLDRSLFDELITGNCDYCGSPPSPKEYHSFPTNGIDRIDSDCGYEPGNVVSCCRRCNIAKAKYGRDDFLSWIERVYKFSVEQEASVGQ